MREWARIIWLREERLQSENTAQSLGTVRGGKAPDDVTRLREEDTHAEMQLNEATVYELDIEGVLNFATQGYRRCISLLERSNWTKSSGFGESCFQKSQHTAGPKKTHHHRSVTSYDAGGLRQRIDTPRTLVNTLALP